MQWSKQPKHTFFCLDLTPCQHATPITHKSEYYQRRDCERHATFVLVHTSYHCEKSAYQALYNLMDSTAHGNRRAGSVPLREPNFNCGGCERQVQFAVVQWAPESYLVSVNIWPWRKSVQQMRKRSLGATERRAEWVISPCQHIWRFLPAAVLTPCICPHLSEYLWLSSI